jgi:hypothetical protein
VALVPSNEHYLGPASGQKGGCGRTYPRACACNHCYFVLELRTHLSPPKPTARSLTRAIVSSTCERSYHVALNIALHRPPRVGPWQYTQTTERAVDGSHRRTQCLVQS